MYIYQHRQKAYHTHTAILQAIYKKQKLICMCNRYEYDWLAVLWYVVSPVLTKDVQNYHAKFDLVFETVFVENHKIFEHLHEIMFIIAISIVSDLEIYYNLLPT